MTDQFRDQMREAAYKSMLKINPKVIEGLKRVMINGEKARTIEKQLVKKYGNYNLTANSTILAAYHLQDHPELLK